MVAESTSLDCMILASPKAWLRVNTPRPLAARSSTLELRSLSWTGRGTPIHPAPISLLHFGNVTTLCPRAKISISLKKISRGDTRPYFGAFRLYVRYRHSLSSTRFRLTVRDPLLVLRHSKFLVPCFDGEERWEETRRGETQAWRRCPKWYKKGREPEDRRQDQEVDISRPPPKINSTATIWNHCFLQFTEIPFWKGGQKILSNWVTIIWFFSALERDLSLCANFSYILIWRKKKQ